MSRVAKKLIKLPKGVELKEVDGVLSDRVALRQREIGPVEAGLPVNVSRDELLAHERPVRTGGNRDVVPAGELEHPNRVCGRLVERLVTRNRRDP